MRFSNRAIRLHYICCCFYIHFNLLIDTITETTAGDSLTIKSSSIKSECVKEDSEIA